MKLLKGSRLTEQNFISLSLGTVWHLNGSQKQIIITCHFICSNWSEGVVEILCFVIYSNGSYPWVTDMCLKMYMLVRDISYHISQKNNSKHVSASKFTLNSGKQSEENSLRSKVHNYHWITKHVVEIGYMEGLPWISIRMLNHAFYFYDIYLYNSTNEGN